MASLSFQTCMYNTSFLSLILTSLSTLTWILSPDMLSHPFWPDRCNCQETNPFTIKVLDKVTAFLTSGWTMEHGTSRRILFRSPCSWHLGHLSSKSRTLVKEIRPSGQYQEFSSHMRIMDTSDNWNRNLERHPWQETGSMSMAWTGVGRKG